MDEPLSPVLLREAFLGWFRSPYGAEEEGLETPDALFPEAPKVVVLRAEDYLAERKAWSQFWSQCRERFVEALGDTSPEEWRAACDGSVEAGSYSVVVSNDLPTEAASLVIACHAGVLPAVADELLKRIQHVGPETILEGVSLDSAIRAKFDLTRCELKVKIKEGRASSTTNRDPIPERVRNEVWRRDSGRCVDCGSRERLEYDHIIPISKGGANTARNLELRCETCNRRKGAAV